MVCVELIIFSFFLSPLCMSVEVNTRVSVWLRLHSLFYSQCVHMDSRVISRTQSCLRQLQCDYAFIRICMWVFGFFHFLPIIAHIAACLKECEMKSAGPRHQLTMPHSYLLLVRCAINVPFGANISHAVLVKNDTLSAPHSARLKMPHTITRHTRELVYTLYG